MSGISFLHTFFFFFGHMFELMLNKKFGNASLFPRKEIFQFTNFFWSIQERLLPANISSRNKEWGIMMININKAMIRHKCDLLITVRLNYLISVYGLQKFFFLFMLMRVWLVCRSVIKKILRLMERAVKWFITFVSYCSPLLL